MGSNYYIICKKTIQLLLLEFLSFTSEKETLKREIIDMIQNFCNKWKLSILYPDELIEEINYCEYFNIHRYSSNVNPLSDKRYDIIHIGRYTNNCFIWHINPVELDKLTNNKMIVHENWSPSNITENVYSLEDFKNLISRCKYDLEYVDKVIDFS